MSKEEAPNPFSAFEKMTKQWQDSVIDSWSAMTRQAVNSESFAQASAQALDSSLAGQKQIREGSAQFLESLGLPKRSDLAAVSKQISQAEMRIADCEDGLDKIQRILSRLEAKLDALGSLTDAPAEAPAAPQPPATPSPAPAALSTSTSAAPARSASTREASTGAAAAAEKKTAHRAAPAPESTAPTKPAASKSARTARNAGRANKKPKG